MRLLMTGATGMLGQELLPLLLKHKHVITAISRSAQKSNHKNLTYVTGNITQENFGNPSIQSNTYDAMLHCAALTSLRQRSKDDLLIANLLGTQNIVHYCLEHSINRLFHVSTAYVCGNRTGTIKETDLVCEQQFKNPYEESKYFAETYIHKFPELNTTIFRPGVIVGRHKDGHAAFFEGFYRPIRAIIAAHSFAEQKLKLPRREKLESALHLPILKLPIRMYGDPESELALTPVDWTASTIAELIEHPENKTYHIVPNKSLTLKLVLEAICEVLSIQGYHVGAGPTRNPLDMFYNRMIRDFRPYLQNQPTFETSVGHTCPVLDKEFIKKIVAYWRMNEINQQEVTEYAKQR